VASPPQTPARGPARGSLIYENPLAAPGDHAGFVLEGQAAISVHEGTTRLASVVDESARQAANYVWWCPQELPADFDAEWDFWPDAERGLCFLFFAARGRGGEDLFDPALPKRSGEFAQYTEGAIDCLQISYYRRRPQRQKHHLCNLRKHHGVHLVASGPDPIPQAARAQPPYRLRLLKAGPHVAFWIDGLPILHYEDDGRTYGPVRGAGRIGFRQMAPGRPTPTTPSCACSSSRASTTTSARLS
jgi:Domain of unknown function (DUF1961)